MRILPRFKLGFSLLEMSIVLLIIAIVLSSGAVLFNASIKKKQVQETQVKLEAIQKALLDYRRAYNRIPCPSDLTQAIGSITFGKQAAKLDSNDVNDVYCNNASPAANYTDGAFFFQGGVPVRTLKLPDDYAYDGWGRTIEYTVDGNLTGYNSFNAIAVNDSNTRLQIWASEMLMKTGKAVYVLVSFGENGYGGHTRAGGATVVTSGSINALEQYNCNCDAGAVKWDPIAPYYMQAPLAIDTSNPANNFDDIVVYATRADLRLPTE